MSHHVLLFIICMLGNPLYKLSFIGVDIDGTQSNAISQIAPCWQVMGSCLVLPLPLPYLNNFKRRQIRQRISLSINPHSDGLIVSVVNPGIVIDVEG
ncbi:hypothetical protein F5I97DRAFT_1854863 [Phlebopus sp. FC_14]|nr:hypothetical protein F5I97DRAFT_1854863 [Phlebopus sp. FC_14]